MKATQIGFHLVEVLFTMAIISITAALSYPIYTNYIMQTRRLEAENTLNQLALAMENFRLEHHTYEHANLAALHFKEMIARKSYRLSIQEASASKYVLAATPLGKQVNDNTCGTLSLNSQQEKDISGNGTLDECWGYTTCI